MLHIDVLTKRADGSAPILMKALSQGFTLGGIPRSVDSMTKSHADETKYNMIGTSSRILQICGRD